MREQSEKLTHIALGGLTHEPAAALAQALVTRAPRGATELPLEQRLTRVFYSDDGSTAVEVALKMAVQFWAQNGLASRTEFVALSDAFHGETVGASSVGGINAFRDVYNSMLFPVHFTGIPSGSLLATSEQIRSALSTFETLLDKRSDHIAGVVVEPLVLGAAGMKMYAPAFLQGVRNICTQYNVLMIVDEVFTGLGRTGTLWASDAAGIVPDLLCTAKALSGAMFPFAATLATERLFNGFAGDRRRAFLYGHSYCGNPLGCAVALAVLDALDAEDVIAGIAARTAMINHCMEQLVREGCASNARTLGMIGAVDLGAHGYHADLGWQVYRAALKAGVYLRPLGDTVYVAPALNIPLPVLEELLAVLSAAIRTVIMR
jgi:adenosylmethionine-8-amino-7-oxononanoate aminotransferase